MGEAVSLYADHLLTGGSIRFPRFRRIDPRLVDRLWDALPGAWRARLCAAGAAAVPRDTPLRAGGAGRLERSATRRDPMYVWGDEGPIKDRCLSRRGGDDREHGRQNELLRRDRS
jgi:hypothetical protein